MASGAVIESMSLYEVENIFLVNKTIIDNFDSLASGQYGPMFAALFTVSKLVLIIPQHTLFVLSIFLALFRDRYPATNFRISSIFAVVILGLLFSQSLSYFFHQYEYKKLIECVYVLN